MNSMTPTRWCPEAFDQRLRGFIEATPIPCEEIQQAIHYTVFSGGKRLRPQLVYLAGELLTIDPVDLHPIAMAIELTHTYSLVHDDLPAMDNDDFRRGRPTCHKAFSEACAILTGDALLALAIAALTQGFSTCTSGEQKINLIQYLLTASGASGMISGQQLDLSLLTQNLNLDQLNKIHHLKTTALIQACIDMVWTVQPAPQPLQIQYEALRSMTHAFGLAYQMQDDYLDHYDPQSLGKSGSSDQANQKLTFARLYSKDTLKQMIHDEFQRAEAALSIFEHRAQALVAWIHQLKRIAT
jgi:farnesyl diphosphate synthase